MEKKTKRRFDWGSFFVTVLGTAIGVAPLDAPDTMIPIEDMPGFYDVMGLTPTTSARRKNAWPRTFPS